jgi:hypothetical protein
MRLHFWIPQGHGEYSFFVVAETKAQAREAVDKHVATLGKYETRGWGTSYYKHHSVPVGEVVDHPND